MKKSTLPPSHIIVLATALITCLLFSVSKTQAAVGDQHTLDEALLLMVSGELWLTGGGEPVASINGLADQDRSSGSSTGYLQAATKSRFSSLIKSAASPTGTARQTEVSINAVKEVIAMKQAAHEQSLSLLEGKVSEETLQGHQEKYDQQIKLLNGVLEELRKQWRREKRFFPKLVKPLKQAGGWFWHKIGPAGRRILRAVGDDIIKMAVMGDPISGQVLKMLIVKHARALGERQGKEFLARLIIGRRPTEARPQPEQAPDDGELLTFDEMWAGVVTQLEEERRTCQTGAIEQYKSCLQANSDGATDWTSVYEKCAEFYYQIANNDPGGIVSLGLAFKQDDPAGPGHGSTYEFRYPSAGGAVTGSYEKFNDISTAGCRVTKSGRLEGTYSLSECTMEGTAYVSYSVESLLGIEGWGVYERDHCFETGNITARENFVDLPVPWQASLINGDLSIWVGDEECNQAILCEGFMFDVWEDGAAAGDQNEN